MTLLDNAIRKATKQSPSIKKLVDLQDAYIHATQVMHKDSSSHVDVLVYEACKFAIQTHAIWMAERAGADQELLRVLKEDDRFSWHSTIYVFIDRLPAISSLVIPLTEEDR